MLQKQEFLTNTCLRNYGEERDGQKSFNCKGSKENCTAPGPNAAHTLVGWLQPTAESQSGRVGGKYFVPQE
jgi:hypothetical protein